MIKSWIAILFVNVFVGPMASAKVFNFGGVSVSSYLRAGGGTAYFGNDAFANSGGAGATYGEGAKYQFTGEFGFAFDLDSFTARIGFEILRPQHLSDYEAKNSGGTVLYTIDSDIICYSPALTLQFPLTRGQSFKSYIFLGGGYGYVNMKNTMAFTATGTSTYSLADFVEDGKTQTTWGTAGWGFETLLVDNVTFGMDFGYRYMEIYKFTYKSGTTNFTGTHVEGATMKNTDGSDRFINLSHPFMGLLLRFYI